MFALENRAPVRPASSSSHIRHCEISVLVGGMYYSKGSTIACEILTPMIEKAIQARCAPRPASKTPR